MARVLLAVEKRLHARTCIPSLNYYVAPHSTLDDRKRRKKRREIKKKKKKNNPVIFAYATRVI